MSGFRVITLRQIMDRRGVITVMQESLPFDVRRVYWITSADGQVRGGHCHRVTRQAMVAVTGSVRVDLDDGRHCDSIVLDEPSRCLVVEPEDWHTMSFDAGAALLVLASHHFDPDDYIDERPAS